MPKISTHTKKQKKQMNHLINRVFNSSLDGNAITIHVNHEIYKLIGQVHSNHN